jgi:RecB family exonuclease
MWLGCREHFRLSYIGNWQSKTSSHYLDFGNACHAVIARAAKKEQKSGTGRVDFQLVREAVEDWAEQARKDYLYIGDERLRQLELTLGQAEQTMFQYFERWNKEDKALHTVSMEQKFKVPFEIKQDISIPLCGTWDRVYLGKDDKGWIRDTKTKSAINEGNIADTFVHDIQFNFYMFAYHLIHGDYPQGVEIDVIRKTASKPTKNDQSLEAYLTRFVGEIKKDPDHFFIRFKAHFLPAEIIKWSEKQLWPMLADLYDWWVISAGKKWALNLMKK